jgi:putative membrane protein
MIIGFLLGLVLGILPGLHINSFAPLLPYEGFQVAAIIFTAAVVANFFEFFRSTIFFSPDDGFVLLTNPVSRMIMEGRMVYAMKLFSMGALIGVLLCCIFSPFLVWFFSATFTYIRNLAPWLILLISFHMIMRDRSTKNALGLFLLSGVLGLAVFGMNIENPLMPMLTGLFGMSSLLSLKRDFPKQMDKVAFVPDKKGIFRGAFLGFFASMLLGFVPAIGPSQASMVSMEFERRRKEEVFISSIGSINTSDVFMSLITYMSINRVRIGAFNYFENNPNFLYPLLFLGMIASIMAFLVMSLLSNRISRFLTKINVKNLKVIILSFVVLIVALLSGLAGMFVLLLSTFLGYIFEKRTIKSHAMGCLIIPVLIGFL